MTSTVNSSRRRRRRPARDRHFRPLVEPLEQRLALSTLTVTPTMLSTPVGSTPHALIATGGTEGLSTFASYRDLMEGMDFDTAGNMYVTAWAQGKVLKITPQGAVSDFATGFTHPQGLAYDWYSGKLYVASQNGSISIVSSSGAVTTLVSSLHELRGITFDSARNLYVSVPLDHNVLKVTPGGSVSVFVTLAGTFPQGLAWENDTLFVSAGGFDQHTQTWVNGTISKVTPAGFVTPFVPQSEGLVGPTSMTFIHGFLYVADTAGKAVYKISPSGSATAVFSNLAGQPLGMSRDVWNNLYFAQGFNAYNILRFGATSATFTVDPADSAVLPSVGLALNGDGTFAGTATAVPISNPLTFHVHLTNPVGDSGSAAISLFVWSWEQLPNALVWTGLGGTPAWSNPNNWDRHIAPTSGNSLIFPPGVSAMTSGLGQSPATIATVNDLSGLNLSAIYLKGDGYTITGNPVTATIGVGSAGAGNTYALNTTLGGAWTPGTPLYTSSAVFDVISGSLNVGGHVTMQSGASLGVNPGTSLAIGPFGGSGNGMFEMGPGGSANFLGTTNVLTGGTLAMRGLDGGGNDVAMVGPAGALNVYGTAEVGWLSELNVQGAATVYSGGQLQISALDAQGGFTGGTGIGGKLNVSGTTTVQGGGTLGMRGLDSGGKDVAIVQPGGNLNVLGALAADWNSSIDVLGTFNIGSGGSFQMGNPASYAGEQGNTLTVYGGGTLGIDAGGSLAMRGFDSGGSDLAFVQAGGSFIDNGAALFGWNTRFDLSGTASVGTGGYLQVGDLGSPSYIPGDPGASFNVKYGGVADVAAGGNFQLGMKGLDSGGHDLAYVDPGGMFNLAGTLDIQNGNSFYVDGAFDPPVGSLIKLEDTSQMIVGASGSLTAGNLALVDSSVLTVKGTITALAAGSVTITGNASLNSASAVSVSLLGTQLTWPQPDALLPGTPLSDEQLSATANLPGTFSYTLADGTTPALGAVLPAGRAQVLNVTFTPTDPSYSPATASVNIDVLPFNHAPSFAKGADATASDNSGAQTLSPWATEISSGPADEANQTVSFQVLSNSNPSLFTAPPAVDPAGKLTFTPAPNAHGTAWISVQVSDSGGTANNGQNTSPWQTFEITINKPMVWHNTLHALDVTNSQANGTDNIVAPGDALAIINYINAHPGQSQIPADALIGHPYVDTWNSTTNTYTGDNFVVPADALAVINFINQNGGSLPGPDGEAAPPLASAAADAVFTQLGAPPGQPSTAEANELLSALLLSTAEQDSTGLRRR